MALSYPPRPSAPNYMLAYGPKHHNLYYVGQPITLLLFQVNADESAQPGHQPEMPTSWRCYDIDGNSWTGSITYTNSNEFDYLGQRFKQFTIAPPAGQSQFQCGWYRVHLFSSYNHPDMPAGASGESTFMVVNHDTNLPDTPNYAEDNWPSYEGSDEILNGLVALGPHRYDIDNVKSPTTEINEILAHAPIVSKWWTQKAAPNRPRRAFVDFPNGTTDCIAVYSNGAGGQGTTGSEAALNCVSLVAGQSWVQISNGTQGGTKKVTVSQPQNTVVETYDNLATWANVVSAINASSTRIRVWSNAPAETAKNVGPVLIETASFNGVVQTVQALYPAGITVFGGPSNEPDWQNAGYTALQSYGFRAAVKAGNPNALVQGPNAVSFNSQVLGWLTSHLSQLPAGFYDIVGIHGYNTTNNDMALTDKMFTAFRQVLSDNGYANKPLWMTEGGMFTSVYGVQHWRRAAHWMALWYLMYEAYGLPRENLAYYYPRSMGYPGFPFYTAANHYKVFLTGPANMFMRGFAERTWNAPFLNRLSFSGPSADMFFGAVWQEPGVSKTVVLINNGMLESQVTLNVSGASTVDVYDWAGNKATQVVTGGKVTVATSDLPVYVVTPASSAVTVSDAGKGLDKLGQNLAQAASKNYQETVNYKDTGSNNLASIISNTVDPDYTQNTDSVAPYRTKGAFPHEIKFKWTVAQNVSRVLLFFAPPWQYRGTPKRFRIDYWNGSAWVTQYSHNDTAMTSYPWVSPDYWDSLRETWWKEQWVWDVPFTTTVNTIAIRLVIEEGGYGGEPDEVSKTDLGQGWDVGVTIREIKIY